MSPARPPTRRIRVLAATLILAATVVACGPEPTGEQAAVDGLVVLVADAAGSASLAVWSFEPTGGIDGTGAAAANELETPGDAMAWIATGRAQVLAATMLDGTILTSDPIGRAGPLAWRPVEAVDVDGDPPPGPAWFASWDPEGGRFATITGDLPGGDDLDLTLVDPSTGGAFVIPLGQALLPSAPVWLDGERVALAGGSTTDPYAVIVDTTTGEITDGPGGDRRFASSADGSVIVSGGGPGEAVVVRSTGAWLDEQGTAIGTIDAPSGDALATSIALDADGDRLAIVWLGVEAGLRVDVHDGTDGWRRVISPPLGQGTQAAIVAWSR